MSDLVQASQPNSLTTTMLLLGKLPAHWHKFQPS
jgi:hypothetical protein